MAARQPVGFRTTRAYLLTLRILIGYAWLRLWRPVLGPSLYNARLVQRHRATSRRLVRAILELDGLFIKVGQLISILTNFLPAELRGGLEQLQDRVPERPLDEVTARIRQELGKPPEELFASFEPVPIASASLAQVHEARLHDGRRVAVKVQHANIEEVARLDLNTLRHILELVQFFMRLRGLESYHDDISQMISEELDFSQEARNIDMIAGQFAGNPEIHFPRIVHELSSRRVLTTEFVEGTKVTDFRSLEAQGIDRPALAQRILTAYCQMVFVDGVYHADPHPGNILVHPDGSVTFVDFGAVGKLAPGLKAGVPLFWDGVIKRDPRQITEALRQMGFVSRDPGEGDEDVAERVIAYFQRKFLEQMTVESFSLRDIQVDMKSKLEALADLKKLDVSFRDLSTAFQVPKEWVVFERASILLLGLCTQIDPGMNPLRTVGPYLQQFVLGSQDREWVDQIKKAIREMAMSAIAIPDAANRLLTRANRGDVTIHVFGVREGAQLLYSAATQVMFAFLAVSLGALAWGLDAAGRTNLAGAAVGAAILCLVAIAGSMIRARALRRILRTRRRS